MSFVTKNLKNIYRKFASKKNFDENSVWVYNRKKSNKPKPMTEAEKTDVENLCEALDNEALNDLLTEVYAELKRLAAYHLKYERANHTLRPTELVHEVYLQLRKQHSLNLDNHAYFLSVASTLMRRILVNHAKRKQRKKRGGDGGGEVSLITLNEKTFIEFEQDTFDLLELENALNELARRDARGVKIIELYFYGGLTFEEIAGVLDVSLRTIMREWRFAKTWLYRKLKRSDKNGLTGNRL